jgi:hypothetical protein
MFSIDVLLAKEVIMVLHLEDIFACADAWFQRSADLVWSRGEANGCALDCSWR